MEDDPQGHRMTIGLKLFKTEHLTLKRQTNLGHFNDRTGQPVSPEFTQTSFDANVQPVTGDELLQMPEGDRTRQVLNVFSSLELLREDIVVRKGIEYEVRTDEDWDQSLLKLSHFMSRIVRIDVQR